MKIKVIAPGELKLDYAKIGVSYYYNKINKIIPCEIIYIKIPRSYTSSSERLKKEMLEIERHIKNCWTFLCDENGRKYENSIEFSKKIERILSSSKDICFVIGDYDGVYEDLKNKVDESISLSNYTFPHELSLLLISEIIYRSLSIIKNIPYHK